LRCCTKVGRVLTHRGCRKLAGSAHGDVHSEISIKFNRTEPIRFSACTDPAPAVLNDWCDNDAIRSRSGCRPSAHSRVVNVRDLTADHPNVRRRRHPGVSSISRRTSGDDRPTSRDPDQIHLLSPMKPREQTTNRSITLPRTRLYAHDLYMCRKKTTEDAWLKKQDRSEGELQPYVPFRNNVHVRYTTHFCSRI